MPLDKIIVLVMALGFFGGIAYIYWKARQEEKKGGRTSSPTIPDNVEGVSLNKLQEKGRRISKS